MRERIITRAYLRLATKRRKPRGEGPHDTVRERTGFFYQRRGGKRFGSAPRMPPKPGRIKPAARCIRCGTQFTAEDSAEVQRLYSQHVINDHGMPSNARHTDTDNQPVNFDE